VKQRLPLLLSTTALFVAVFGATPLGHAAARAVGVVPYATKAGFAKKASLAYEATRLDGHLASTTPLPAQIPVLGSDGKLPASLGSVGPQGPAGPTGTKGDKGDPGATSVVVRRADFTLGPQGGSNQLANCAAGERAVGGGAGPSDGSTSSAFQVLDSKPLPIAAGSTPTGWDVGVQNKTNTTLNWSVWVICAKP
jgi:hypothetical protein